MAFAATTDWESRTDGSDSNGIGFDSASSGTDRTQQAAAQTAYTDLVIDGATNTKATSAAHPFGATDVGNVVNITGGAGFTVQRAQIVSVAAAVATFDKSLGTLGSTGGTGNLGGAALSPALIETLVVAGNRVFYKNGTYSISSSSANVAGGRLNLNVSGSATARIQRIGYGTNRSAGNTDTKPIFQATVGLSTNYVVTFNNANSYNSIENVTLDANTQTNSGCMNGNGRCNYADNCKFTNGSSGIAGVNIDNNFAIMRFEVTGCQSGTNAAITINNGTAFNGYVHANAARGFQTAYSGVYSYIISSANTGAAGYGFIVTGSTSVTLLNCSAYNNAQDGFYEASNASDMMCVNCIGEQNLYNFNHATSQHAIQLYNCAGYNGTSGNYPTSGSSTPQVIQNFNALTTSPFTNAASGDFSLNNTAGGGAACRAAGIPGVFPAGLTTGYLDIGAVQSQSVAADQSGGIQAFSPGQDWNVTLWR